MSTRPLSAGAAVSLRPLPASAARLACWVSRWRRMSCSPSSTRPRLPPRLIAGGFQAFEQIGHALFEMRKGRGAVVADRHAVEAVGQGPQRALELLGVFAGHRPARGFPASRSARRCAVRAPRANRRGLRSGTSRSTLDDSVWTSSLSRASASLEATLETMERSAAIAPSSWWMVEGSSLVRTIRSSLAPRLRIASS